MAGRPLFALFSLILTAGAIVLIFLTLLAGTINSSATNKVFFIEADTSGIKGAPGTTRWTFWNYCAGGSSAVDGCEGVHPAFPFDPPNGRNFGTTDGVPEQFIGTKKFFLLTRFMFAFVLIGLTFAVFSLLTGLLALCARIGAFVSGLLVIIGAFFQGLAAIVMTVAFIQGRNAFRSDDRDVQIGRYAFGFMWSAFAALFLSSIFFCLAGTSGRKETTSSSHGYGSSRRKGFFGGKRSRSTRSRGSLRKDFG